MKIEKITTITIITIIMILIGANRIKADTYTPGNTYLYNFQTNATGTSFNAGDYGWSGSCAVNSNCYIRSSSYTTPGASGNYWWRGFRVQITKGTTNFIAGNGYEIKLVIGQNNRIYWDNLSSYKNIAIYGRDLNNEIDTDKFTSTSCKYTKATDTAVRYTLTCTIIPNQDLNLIRIVVIWPNDIANGYSSLTSYEGYNGRSVVLTKLYSINVEESEGIGSKIDQTNTLIQNMEDIIIQNNINIINAIEQDHTYEDQGIIEDLGDIIDGMEEQEDIINEMIGIQEIDLDLHLHGNAYAWIWNWIEIFRKGVIIEILTAVLIIGLMKMILNR